MSYTIELTRPAADKLQQQTSKVSDRIRDGRENKVPIKLG
jgi:hypothetical protein